jgi:hypothetical protein
VYPDFAFRVQFCHDIPVSAENTVYFSHIAVTSYAFLFVVVSIAAGIRTEFLVGTAVQYIIAFQTTPFHNVTFYISVQ